jgi:hypothetical protein
VCFQKWSPSSITRKVLVTPISCRSSPDWPQAPARSTMSRGIDPVWTSPQPAS